MGTPDVATNSILTFPNFSETEVPAEDRNNSASGLLDEFGFVHRGNGIYVRATWRDRPDGAGSGQRTEPYRH